ncbi:MAG: TIGR03960 family B12-binding radical SAM protein [Candidatus Omnitrophica bacterium]|nr:TIGR03960 family B12-binding radical SAM protein [Candidatus Omnitrophota bacterium]
MLNENLLLGVRRPGRYIGHEWNVSRKDHSQADVSFCLCFPDLYDVGMSNLGLRILYDILNKKDSFVCERLFCPDTDMQDVLKQNNKLLYSLESGTPVKDFDFLGFSLGYELLYTNVLSVLELSGIPCEAAFRDQTFPLIIGGGPCVLNPEPMHEFFDLFVIGEAEDASLEICDVYSRRKKDYREGRFSKEDLLRELAKIKGVYVPSLYDVKHSATGAVESFTPRYKDVPAIIEKRIVADLDKAVFPVQWLVPYVQVIHDRVTLEIMRGCPNTCRFCQARSLYYPLRFRAPDTVMNLAMETYRCTGYEEMALGGLSVSDYPGFGELLKPLVDYFKKYAVSISLPSIRPKLMLGSFSSLIASVRKTGLTFAPEAGSERLREVLSKNFETEDFFTAVEESYKAGYQHVKLYFMTGLPTEKIEDLDALSEFSVKVSDVRRKTNRGPAEVNISINTMIPKPHTAFQWAGMDGPDGMKEKQDYLKDKVKNKRLKFNFHNRYMSFLEGIFSRGDRRLSRVILRAYKKGCRFDAWSEHFHFETWMDAFKEEGISPEYYLREKSTNELLPWDFISTGVSKDSLLREYRATTGSA